MNPIFEKPFTFDRVVRMVIFAVLAVVFFSLLKQLSSIILPFLLAWLLAYMIHPIVKLFQYKLKLKYRSLSVAVSLIIIGSIIYLLFWLLMPSIIVEIKKMIMLISKFINNNQNFNNGILPAEWQAVAKDIFGSLNLQEALSGETILAIVKKSSPEFWKIISSSFNFLISIFIVFIILLYLIFILVDYENMANGWISFIPEKSRDFVTHLVDDLEHGMNTYFRSQSLIAFIVGILFAIGFKIIGLPLAIVFGLFVGLLNLVPYLQTLGLIPAMALAALKAVENNESYWMVVVSVLIVFSVVQTFQDVFLVPKIMGKTTGLKPAVILLSLSVWGALLGVVGMIIALPMTTLLISYYKRFVLWERKSKKALAKENSNG